MERYLDNYTPHAKRQCVEEKEEDTLPNVEVNAIVYAYCQNVQGCARTDHVPLYDSSIHGKPVYVGQTIQDINARDKQHVYCAKTPFDQHFTNRTQYTLVVLCRRTFAPATTPSAFRDDTLRPAAEWMDFKEAHFISHFDTYHNGWNSTQGGQGRAWLVAMREAKAKVMAKRFQIEYMPAFRDFHEKHGHINVPNSHHVLGRLVSRIRYGDTPIPPRFEDELMGMCLDLRNQHIVDRDLRWESEYMPAFREYRKKHPDINVPRSHVLGMLVTRIRTENTTIPPRFEDELMGMCLDLRNQHIVERDLRWENEYMPAFREYRKKHPDINVPRSHVLGMLVKSVRTGNTTIPPRFEDELVDMGLDKRNRMIVTRDLQWDNDYMPELRAFYKEHGHPNAPQTRLLHNIRSGCSTIPPQHEDEFKEWGFFWCTQNLARHVSRMLGRTVVSLEDDAAAKDAVAKAAAHHATLRALRFSLTKEARKIAGLTKVPLGKKNIGDGIARFYTDVERMPPVVVEECRSPSTVS